MIMHHAVDDAPCRVNEYGTVQVRTFARGGKSVGFPGWCVFLR